MAATGGLYEITSKRLRLTAKVRALSVLGVLLLVGSLLGFLNVPLAASAANTINVAHIGQAVPLDPASSLWDQAQEATIPLSSQQIYQPGGGSTRGVTVRAMEDGTNIGFRVTWDDNTKNDTTGMVPSDAAAIQLPINPTNLPYQCMGQSSNRVNIWQWKAALERDSRESLADLTETGGVRNLTSNGICRAVDAPGIDPEVQSLNDGKQWHVVFRRALSTAAPGTAPLVTSLNTSAAFAVWNGALGETKSMKAVSTWNPVIFATNNAGSAGGLLTLGIVVALSAGAVIWVMRRMARS